VKQEPLATHRAVFGVKIVKGIFKSGLFALCFATMVHAAEPVPHEQVEWTWAEFPDSIDPRLPNVLIEGDSISRNYYHDVETRLAGTANVFLFATSACIGDPALPRQLKTFAELAQQNFKVVHFNNGMHGWKLSEAQYRAGFPSYLAAIRAIAPNGHLIWAAITSVRAPKDGATDERIDARNTIAKGFVTAAAIPIDDQNVLMRGRTSLYQDDIHFGPDGSAIQGETVAKSIRVALGVSGP
jgi:hypothetical protein